MAVGLGWHWSEAQAAADEPGTESPGESQVAVGQWRRIRAGSARVAPAGCCPRDVDKQLNQNGRRSGYKRGEGVPTQKRDPS